jgi:hypothetical protein
MVSKEDPPSAAQSFTTLKLRRSLQSDSLAHKFIRATSAPCSSRMLLANRSTFIQKLFNVFPQCEFHVAFRLLKAVRVDCDWWVIGASFPAVITEPDLAFNAQTGRHPQTCGCGGGDTRCSGDHL